MSDRGLPISSSLELWGPEDSTTPVTVLLLLVSPGCRLQGCASIWRAGATPFCPLPVEYFPVCFSS